MLAGIAVREQSLLPPQWQACVSCHGGRLYYFDAASNRSQWEPPDSGWPCGVDGRVWQYEVDGDDALGSDWQPFPVRTNVVVDRHYRGWLAAGKLEASFALVILAGVDYKLEFARMVQIDARTGRSQRIQAVETPLGGSPELQRSMAIHLHRCEEDLAGLTSLVQSLRLEIDGYEEKVHRLTAERDELLASRDDALCREGDFTSWKLARLDMRSQRV